MATKRHKQLSNQELVAIIQESNKAHEFARVMGALAPAAGTPNPLLDNLYAAATRAAKELGRRIG